MPVTQASAPSRARSSAATLASRAAVVRTGPVAAGVLDGDVDAVALLERAPGGQRLREQHAGVDGDEPGLRRDARRRPRPAPTPPSGRRRASPACRRGARRPRRSCVGASRAAGCRSDRAFAFASDHLEGDVAAPVDEHVHRLEAELDRQREVADGVLERSWCRRGGRSRGTARPPRAPPGTCGSSGRRPPARAWRRGAPSGARRRRPCRVSNSPATCGDVGRAACSRRP